MTIELRLAVLSWKLQLGRLASAVRLQWRSLYLTRLWLSFILYGLAAAVCMLGLVILVEVSACWLTTSCWSQLTALG